MNNLPRKNLLAVLISSALLVTGCGGGGNSAGSGAGNDLTDGGTDNSDLDDGRNSSINPFSGSSNIAGTIALSSLNGSDAGSLDTSGQSQRVAARRARAAVSTDNAIIKLFSVAANGELEETGIKCNFDTETNISGNPKYSCEGIADGNNYVVKYVRILEGNRALEMKVSVQVPEGTTDVPADDVSPQSTVVSDTIINAILTATEGKEIDQEILDDIIASVEKVVKELVGAGAVQLPSMVGEAPKNEAGEFITDASDLNTEEKVDFAENDALDATAGSLLSDEKVSAEVNAVKVEIEIRDFANVDTGSGEGKRKLVKKIFRKLLDGDDDIPTFIVDFFTEQFEQNETVTAATLYDAIFAGMEVNEDLVDFDLNDEQFGFSAANAVSDLQQTLNEIYALFSRRDANALVEGDKEQLAEIPGIIPAIFPAGTTITPETVLDIPQSIVFTIFVSDKYMTDVIEDETGFKDDDFVSVDSNGDNQGDNQGSGNDNGPVEIEFERLIDFNPMHFDESGQHPGLLQLFGFFEPEYLNELSGVDVGRLDIHPETVWIENQDGGSTGGPSGREYDALRADVCVADASSLAGLMNGDAQAPDFSVELTYPNKSGERVSIPMQSERDLYVGSGSDGDERDGGDFDACFVLDPWAAANRASPTEKPTQPSPDDLVSDFASGKYTVIVRDSAGVVIAEREFKRKVIVGMRNASPRLTSPNGRPNWPAECNGVADRCEKFEEREAEFRERGGNTSFALNADTNNDGVNDKAEITLSWKKPRDLELPEGVRIAYSMNVVSNAPGKGDSGWENVYSTHQNDQRLFGRSFTLPVLLDQLEAGQGNYHVDICAEFIDTDNGEFLGRGGCGFAQFNVGEPLDLSAQFNIEGNAPSGLDSSWKVALISEEFQPYNDANPETFIEPKRTTRAVSSLDSEGRYTLNPTIGDFLNGPQSTHHVIILFKDENGDNEPQNSANPDNNQHEPNYWPNYDSNVRFETWDNVLRVVSERDQENGEFDRSEIIVKGGEKIEGPDFSYLDDEDWFQNDVNGSLGSNGSGSDVTDSDGSDNSV